MAKILIVEDDENIVKMLRVALEAKGYLVEPAACANTALTWLKESSKPDLIIIDIGLPDMDGLKLCQMIKDDPATRKIPVVILTANMTNDAKIRANLIAHADLFLTKPIDLKELTNAINALIEKFIREKEFLHDISLRKKPGSAPQKQ
ncbi:MAG: response regulator [Elusimicrobia bacterium]|nr:response regulator [Elusimicrobiota bacterium]